MRPDARMEAVLDFLQSNDHRHITVRQLAASVGLSTSRFSHLFFSRVGMTPAKHLRLIRLFEAEQQLAITFFNLPRIAARIGDGSH